MNKNLYCLVLFFLCLITLAEKAKGQPSFIRKSGISKTPEKGLVIVAGGGVSTAVSDFCNWRCSKPGRYLGLGALYKISPYVSVSASLDNVKFGARTYSMSFETEAVAVTGTVDVNLIDSYVGSGGYRSLRKRFIVPYVKAGVGFIHYTPTSYPGEGELDESQTKYDPARKYPALAAVVPVGGGLRFRFSDKISIAGELIYHFTSTDYLDNTVQDMRNTSIMRNDGYGVAAVKVLYTPVVKNPLFSGKRHGR
ncbi:outer membrane beta-barrel protein [Pontibacter silvestris]|uniref:Outer membrane beta-barrel protein n=1 Tax=Pontibacter silvestris TaxID=2305183 RepID=A0ABW4X3B6_9BACT|nr:outer membrane beta-barrel protein [Pontibacter silvestris]MCC9135006.1 porin family protein [Pontibacter silvestris]